MDDDDFQRLRKDLDRVVGDLNGNGKPGLKREVQVLKDQTTAIHHALYHNPQTGEAGLVATSRQTLETLRDIQRRNEVHAGERAAEARMSQRWWKVLAWIAGFLGIGVLGSILRSIIN